MEDKSIVTLDDSSMHLCVIEDGEVTYATTYPLTDDEIDACAQDFHTVAIQCVNPIDAGWEDEDTEYEPTDADEIIADTGWGDGTPSSVIMLTGEGDVLRRFVMAFLAELE